VAAHGTGCGFQDAARTAVGRMVYIPVVPVILEVTCGVEFELKFTWCKSETKTVTEEGDMAVEASLGKYLVQH